MHNHFLLGQDEGGEYTMSMAYLLSWEGPVWESEDPYGDGFSPDGLKAEGTCPGDTDTAVKRLRSDQKSSLSGRRCAKFPLYVHAGL